MSDSDKPNPIEDLRKGLGLLFRAAKTTIDKLPTGEIEAAVISGAKEVGRAVENVAHTVEEQFLRKPTARAVDEEPAKTGDGSAEKPGAGEGVTASTAATEGAKSDAPKEPADGEKKRVG